MLEGEEELFVDFIGRSSGRRSDGCSRAVRSGSDVDLSSSKSEFLRKRNRKEGREMDAAVDYEALDTFNKSI
jgi:hypothetical protein